MNFFKTCSTDSSSIIIDKHDATKENKNDDVKSWVDTDHDHWSSDIEDVLDKMRQNCVILSELHKRRYFALQGWLKYFRLPCILLSSVNAVASVGLATYIEQKHVSLINCIISLVTTIITSIEMYLQIEKQMGVENDVSKEYYLLSVDIYKILRLKRYNRNIDAYSFLDNAMSKYKNLYENSAVLQKKIPDKLTIILKNTTEEDMKSSKDVYDYENDEENKSNDISEDNQETGKLVDVYLNSSFIKYSNGLLNLKEND